MQRNTLYIQLLALLALTIEGAVGCGGTIVSSSNDAGVATGGSSTGPQGGASSLGGATSINNTSVNADPTLLSSGDSNQISTGGFWWTYTDHNPDGSPYHASISQLTSNVVGLQPTVDSDPNHGNVLRVYGTIPPALPWSLVSVQDSSTIDKYWQSVYPDAAIPAYPTAGIGFGFQRYHVPFDATGGGRWVGIAFDMKANIDMQVVWVSMPTPGTDLPDPQFADNFPNQCRYYTNTNTPATGGESCFVFYRKGIFSRANNGEIANTLAAPGTWNRYCVLYSEVSVPNWANAMTVSMLPSFDPTHLLKVIWGMFEPGESGVSAAFDVSLDNVNLITATQARDPANNCDQARIGLAPGTGDAG